MFYDQLLANYLSQLQHIRQLFAFLHPPDIKSQHTYFLNTLTTVPEMDKLLRFGQGNGLGPPGTVLAFPVDKTDLDTCHFRRTERGYVSCWFPCIHVYQSFGVYEATDLLRNDLVNDGESQVCRQGRQ